VPGPEVAMLLGEDAVRGHTESFLSSYRNYFIDDAYTRVKVSVGTARNGV
jgi:hypothetical protein